MHLQIQTSTLNDSCRSLPQDSIVPSDQQVCDCVLLIWREEPATEDIGMDQLLQKVKERYLEWKVSQESLQRILSRHNLYATDEGSLRVYSDKVRIPTQGDKKLTLPRNVTLAECSGEKQRGLFANGYFKQGEAIFDDMPAVVVPPMEKLLLMQTGKACSLCGNSVNHTAHSILMNGLDCGECQAIWCSKNCKKGDITHSSLKHTKSRIKQINLNGWFKYERFCKKNVFEAAYSFGVIYASILIDKNGKEGILDKFQPLCEVSQRLRKQLSDSNNLGGTLDASSGAISSEDPEPMWQEAYKLFRLAFPESEEVTMETYLTYIGKFNINQVAGQIYPTYAFINHDCEPNVRYEIDDKLRLKLYARKPINKGEELLTTYVNPLHGVNLRRRELRVNWGFLCHCNRCKKDLTKRKEQLHAWIAPSHCSPASSFSEQSRRKSSMRSARPDLNELLKNGQEFDLEIPEDLEGVHQKRRTSVRFDNKVSVAVEE
ncbi:related to Potential protein lysine methyltransferase SET5 [Zygosaccharomyces bailii ISA1307]|uniref:Histone-lysine N-methyltransferase SET5 n=1 Tax=Zygosaccharomyces bailii (strain CLIB 213 / ATCC 58445 / CBS 680 / BCRC 21525 / NBRC 1098 / NCYC 1416 / NRRL Y-2227) TaxID=1333698 RepID=A0A8J2TB51_ZYGB2|nr:ZYBA0S13-00650g1_1 [Zygosaccharomyces bailii CLIB 213]CDH16772.1 related to Potential protein lysine methyltransferase SET5 [Zygosaccharomyces bailii ISA1307]